MIKTDVVKILYVEDNIKMAESVKKGLTELGYSVTLGYNVTEAKKLVSAELFDLYILDLLLPGGSGLEICKQIRSKELSAPIILLTALSNIEKKIEGFDLGADDYIVKPFEFAELNARIKNLLKRAPNYKSNENILRVGDLEIDIIKKSVKRNGQLVILTTKEFNLLEYLLRNKGRVVPKAELALNIWELSFDTGTNIIEVYINYLRKKIEKDSLPKLIYTQVGTGYFIPEELV
jgi:DNA-binding response OmpR family regulator